MHIQHVDSFAAVTGDQPTVLAVGSFDGVHRGHQSLLRQALAAAGMIGARLAVLTFFPNPREIISGTVGRYYLMRLQQRVDCLASLGAELIITHPFDETVRQTRAADFVQQMIDHLNLRQLWGGNFSLGYQREGDFDYLSRLGNQQGFSVFQVAPLLYDGERISSTRIRAALLAGRLPEANACLNRPYALSGEVVSGRRLGRTIGVPTANVAVWEQQVLPQNGVYATRVQLAGDDTQSYIAATNVGVRPTVDGHAAPSVEAHLLDFDQDIYGRQLRVDFIERIRDELKFDGLAALKQQIGADIETVRQMLQPQQPAQNRRS